MEEFLAYIDESGDPIIGIGASKTFLIGAIIIKKLDLPELNQAITDTKKKYGLNELKSNRVSDSTRRFEICRAINSVEIKIATIRVNKAKLIGDWFKFKGSFYKYVQGKLNHEIYRLFSSVEISIDRYGSVEYQNSFQKYLEAKLQGELFEPGILVDTAKVNHFIQASDFIFGSIRKSLEGELDNGSQILSLFESRWPIRIEIPDDGTHVSALPISDSKRELPVCMDEVKRYLDKNSDNEADAKLRTLEYLYYAAIDGSNEYVFTHEVLEWLGSVGLPMSEEQFRTEVTAALRDEGLIIVGTRKGIKIPRTVSDLEEYMAFSVNLALPVLKRLKKALNFIATRTPGIDLEILLSDEMRKILKEINV